jgi:hypothetical protein
MSPLPLPYVWNIAGDDVTISVIRAARRDIQRQVRR